MIKTYNNTLNEDLIKNIFRYLKKILDKDVWSSSNAWDQNLVLNSSNILTHLIGDECLRTEIKHSIENKIKLKFEEVNLYFHCSIYLWGGGSYITWHPDCKYPYNGTIYLNEKWDSNDGGVFLYKENKTNQIMGIEPQYNLMVVNSGDESNPHNFHCVTCILPSVIKKRITIQWRTIEMDENKKNNFKYQ